MSFSTLLSTQMSGFSSPSLLPFQGITVCAYNVFFQAVNSKTPNQSGSFIEIINTGGQDFFLTRVGS